MNLKYSSKYFACKSSTIKLRLKQPQSTTFNSLALHSLRFKHQRLAPLGQVPRHQATMQQPHHQQAEPQQEAALKSDLPGRHQLQLRWSRQLLGASHPAEKC